MLKKLKDIPWSLNKLEIKKVSLVFLLFVFFFESFLFDVRYSDFFISVYDKEPFAFGFLLIIFLILSIYLFFRFIVFSLSSSWHFKAPAFFVFFLFTFIEYSYFKAIGRFTDKYDFEMAYATTSDQQIASVLMYSNLLVLIPALIFLVLILLVRSKETFKVKKEFPILCSLFLIFYIAFQALFTSSNHYRFPTITFMSFGRTTTDFIFEGPFTNGKWAHRITGIKVFRKTVKKPELPKDFTPGKNIILVIDESVRADHLSLNGYHRSTTPFLEELERKNLLKNWGIAVSATTASLSSYNAIITGLTPDEITDRRKLDMTPTLFQYAKAMNYKTHFFDGQMDTYWGGIKDDKNYIDNWVTVKQLKKDRHLESWEHDEEIAKRIKKIINTSSGNFILIFKKGSHVPYYKNFPSESAVWKPNFAADLKAFVPTGEDQKAAINTYDNSLKYNIDNFFQTLVDDYSNIPNNSIIIYTSDHGQTLYENGKASHGGKTRNEAMVPLFIIGKLNKDVDTKFKASHKNLYPTIQDLLEYPHNLRKQTSVLSLLEAKAKDSKPRYFNPGINPKVPYD